MTDVVDAPCVASLVADGPANGGPYRKLRCVLKLEKYAAVFAN